MGAVTPGRVREAFGHFATWYIAGYLILVLALAFIFYIQRHDRTEAREALCDALTTYTRALGAGREFTEKDAQPFLQSLNQDLQPLGCVITYEEIRGGT